MAPGDPAHSFKLNYWPTSQQLAEKIRQELPGETWKRYREGWAGWVLREGLPEVYPEGGVKLYSDQTITWNGEEQPLVTFSIRRT
jgi:hypothetical protein